MRHKTQRSRSDEAALASPWWLPQPWRPPFPPGCFGFSWLFVFLRDFSVCDAVLSLKKDVSGFIQSRIHSLAFQKNSLKLHWRIWKTREEDQAEAMAKRENREIIAPAFE